MSINISDIKNIISCLGFHSQKDETIWEKSYSTYRISINFQTEKIIYPEPLSLGDETTSNFSNSENFVVLECVDRLLTIGYKPSSIILENKWSVGRTNKGKLDILIKDKHEKSYLMIECKTWGSEYLKEKNKMLKDGGQLISYYQQDRNTQYLCLYSSRLENNKIEYTNDIIKIEEDFRTLADVKEVYNRWNKQFIPNGIFNESPYKIKLKSLTKKDLKELKKEDSALIYNQFLEILRHNVVSDKGNAFNKIFNLFLCKVLDEDKQENTQLDFQWIEEKDDYKSLLKRLNDLYKNGMKKYLQKDITDYNEDDLKNNKNDRNIIQILEELRLYKDQGFAFLEVFNQATFEENSKIVKEVVQLLQGWQIRYTHKQQFLGEFFELLLNTGFKQESGQFFTPVPLVRFILKSLPIKEIIEEKINNNEDNFLPYLIDFACGSGHFLTESMDIIQKEIETFQNNNLSTTQRKKLKHYQEGDYEWAKEFIYGIEKDYRLVKTTKLACFLHGDGEAQIIHASGIAPFGKDEYKGKLEKPEQFDLLVANPPYSVSGFRSTVKNGDNLFTLFKNISDNSSDIEVLFIERMKQLLKPNALAAIILPSTILSNAGNYEKARELILSNFELKAILNIGQGGFMETGTSTVTLFLKKLNNTLLLSNKEDYKKMTIDKKLLIVNSGEKEVEKNFLGYEFSKRRGTEGLKKLDSNLLYNEDDRFDEQYANSYILKSMLNYDYIPINDKLKNHISLISLTDCFNWDREVFSNSMQLKKKLQIKSNYKLEKLGNVTYIKKGNTITEETADLTGNIPVIAGGKISPYNHSKSNYKGNIITISASGEAGYVWYHDYPIWASDCFVLSSSNEKNISTKYIFYILEYLQDTIYSLQSGIAQKHVYEKDIINLEIPIANFKIQENIIKFLEEQELNIQEYKSKSTILEKNIDDIEIPQSNYMRLEKLNNLQFGIGKRILKNKIANQGYYPIYSANVFVPFGYKNQLLNKNISGLDFSNFSNSSIIWGIDGDWMVNYIEKEKPFVPTDHCGILRVTNDSICNTKYLSHVIKIAGEKAGFSRSYRASIDRIKQLEIPYIDIKSQNIIASKIIEYEFEISRLKELIQKAKIKQKKFIKDILDLEIL